MATRETYVLHIYRSRAIRGWQWAARLDHLPGGESRRFTDPQALIEHLHTLIVGSTAAEDLPPLAPGPEDPETRPQG